MASSAGSSLRVHTWRGAAAVTLQAGDVEATFIPELGMLGGSLRHRGEERLALPGGLARYRQGHTLGLPLLSPWANRLSSRCFRVAGVDVDLRDVDLHADENGLPIHGTMTAQRGWQTVTLEAGRRTARMVTTFVYDRPELLAAFPFPHRLTIDASVNSRGLRVATTLSPAANAVVPVSFGFHPYFRLPPPRASWRLRMPASHRLELDGRGIPTGASQPWPGGNEPIGDRVFDDLFALGPDRRFRLESRGRRIEVELGGDYPYSQLYAPPGKPFACIEAMTAPTDGLVTGVCPLVEPGGSFTAVFTIRLA